MFGLSSILFPTDLSPTGRQAFLHAASLAAHTGATVHVLHVAPEAPGAPHTPARPVDLDENRLRTQLQIDLQSWHAHVGAGQARRVTLAQAEVGGGPPDVAILEEARRRAVDLIVMGTHGRRGLWHLLFGSVAEAVLRNAPCPVLTVRHTDHLRPVHLAHVLVPLDFSPHDAAALAYARQIALLHHASLSLLFVAEEHLVPIPYDTGMPAVTLLRTDPEIASHAGEALRRLDAATEAPDLPTAYHVRHGDAVHEVTAFAEAGHVDLIVMSRNGHTASGATSPVTEKVVRAAPCPVLTLPGDVPAPAATSDDSAAAAPPFTERYHHGSL